MGEDGQSEKQLWLHPIAAVAVVVALFVVAQIVAALLVSGLLSIFRIHASSNGGDAASIVLQFVFIFLAESLVLACLWLMLKRLRIRPADIGVSKPKLAEVWGTIGRALGGFCVYFAGYIIAVAVLSKLIPGLNVGQKQDVGFDNASGAIPLVLVVVALICLAPLAEEILMRGFLFTSLRRRKASFVVAALVTSVVFASAHLLGGEPGASLLWIAGIDTFILSLVLCYLRERTGRVWAGVGVHALKNTVAFISLFLLHAK